MWHFLWQADVSIQRCAEDVHVYAKSRWMQGENRQRLIKVQESALYLSWYPLVLWYLIISFPDNDLAVGIPWIVFNYNLLINTASIFHFWSVEHKGRVAKLDTSNHGLHVLTKAGEYVESGWRTEQYVSITFSWSQRITEPPLKHHHL